MKVNELIKNKTVIFLVKVVFDILIILNFILSIIILKSNNTIKDKVVDVSFDLFSLESDIENIQKDIDDINYNIDDIRSDVSDIEYYLK